MAGRQLLLDGNRQDRTASETPLRVRMHGFATSLYLGRPQDPRMVRQLLYLGEPQDRTASPRITSLFRDCRGT